MVKKWIIVNLKVKTQKIPNFKERTRQRQPIPFHASTNPISQYSTRRHLVLQHPQRYCTTNIGIIFQLSKFISIFLQSFLPFLTILSGALPDPLCARFFTLSTFAKGTFRICNNVAHNWLQGFAVCKSRAKVGLGVK